MARNFHTGKEYTIDLRKAYIEDEDILVYGSNVRGGAAENIKASSNKKVTESKRKELAKMID